MSFRSTLLVQNIPKEASESDILNAFVIFGDVAKVIMNESKFSALVEFAEEIDAAAAIDNMNLSELYGQTIYVTFATKGDFLKRTEAIWKNNAEQFQNSKGEKWYISE